MRRRKPTRAPFNSGRHVDDLLLNRIHARGAMPAGIMRNPVMSIPPISMSAASQST
jgi:hypothetical protein